MSQTSGSEGVCAIFIHAGAGFHSHENEHKHLRACEIAALKAMAFLKSGGTAVDAVEAALMVLEDNPITNAGFGSNLNAKGVVEGDASIVDHNGLSGAAGAVPNIKNPIMLARKIYDKSNVQMGMSRVPPNFLVGEGAKDFAWEHGMVIIPEEALISPVALERYEMWAAEVNDYENETRGEVIDPWIRRPMTPLDTRLERLERASQPGAHTAIHAVDEEIRTLPDPSLFGDVKGRRRASLDRQTQKKAKLSNSHLPVQPVSASSPSRDGSPDAADSEEDDEDSITDTVGAIAVDKYGNIAAGSSSGGIGMKHRGRIGPAALIGIGTHVIPRDPTDPDGTTCAVVTSGTGELIASTLAASTCAQRMYYSQKMGDNGVFTQAMEEDALKAWMKREFNEHSAVSNSILFGALGVVVVKKDNSGIELYFAHNTDSFAIASMSSNSNRPSCLMSRGSRGTIAQGGCRIRFPNLQCTLDKNYNYVVAKTLCSADFWSVDTRQWTKWFSPTTTCIYFSPPPALCVLCVAIPNFPLRLLALQHQCFTYMVTGSQDKR
ncbi:Peptidase T2, asparaginase 2 [Penicillium italicum]|uniref:Peptidase T2, asparaginase 2 n=1 Tax=Penicillium italicum TaxID=40296 RepID=A0A0A2LCD7_PENIT|nr:Peptidase T2, asparaginase 2 [Penicillium italicum]